MKTFRKIIFPVDFSERSAAAARYVASVAGRFDSEVVLFHVIEPPPEVYGPLETAQTDIREEELKSFQLRSLSAANVRRVLTVGDPARRITDFAKQEGADLIMMPTHGYGPFRRFILGSVTAKVLHDADCAVWTAAHIEDLPSVAEYSVGNVVCAVDLDEKGKTLLKESKELADEYGARLVVAHAIPATEARPDMYLDSEFRLSLIQMAEKELREMMCEVGAEGMVCVHAGEIAKIIRHSALSHRADLLVIGRASPGLMGRLKTHSYSIIRESPCPVLSL